MRPSWCIRKDRKQVPKKNLETEKKLEPTDEGRRKEGSRVFGREICPWWGGGARAPRREVLADMYKTAARPPQINGGEVAMGPMCLTGRLRAYPCSLELTRARTRRPLVGPLVIATPVCMSGAKWRGNIGWVDSPVD